MAINFKNLAVGDLGKIIGFEPSGKAYRKRLLAMGLTPNTIVTVKRVAPMGDPMQLLVRGYDLSLRKQEASILEVEFCI